MIQHYSIKIMRSKAKSGLDPLALDELLKDNVLDLWEPINELVQHSGENGIPDLYELIPDHYQAGREKEEFTDELTIKHKIPHTVLVTRLYWKETREENATSRLYMAFGFVLGARLSGASDEKVKELLNTYTFGLSEPKAE